MHFENFERIYYWTELPSKLKQSCRTLVRLPIGGYMVNKIQRRSKCITSFDYVKGELESLPKDFTAKDLTERKSKGYLKFASSINLFRLLKFVEK
ncbi:hypothetical protein OUZ56_026612 [Daphnia magna]|uniref:Uncharacterized protein n=1 Tax=Daphnia magna TaxID=35525 RepID=A0ABQ9ZN22_9CRUS|nr:hypothetical protein OUZ56_026612 [Daphnia magna]